MNGCGLEILLHYWSHTVPHRWATEHSGIFAEHVGRFQLQGLMEPYRGDYKLTDRGRELVRLLIDTAADKIEASHNWNDKR